MSETFGSRLRRFALAVDIVDDDVFRDAWNLVRQYIDRQLHPSYWALLVVSDVNLSPGLLARECSVGNRPAFSIMVEGGYSGLAAYSFAEEKPLWVVSSNQKPLSPDQELKDQWSNAERLPRFDRSGDEGIQTVILVPLRWKGRTLGVLDLQSKQITEWTKKIGEEMCLLADALSVLLMLYETNQSRRDQTLEAISLHLKALQEENWPSLTKPTIFVASSGRADEQVMGAVRSILDTYKDQLQVRYWAESSANGSINYEILRQIQNSHFGLCYFSEPVEGRDSFYNDNTNVVFEAGMIHSLTSTVITEDPSGWIPVRESPPSTPPPPFDFAQQRMILIERVGNGTPNIDKLKGELKNRIDSLLR